MESEHLRNVRPTWVAFGWFISFAVLSAIILALVAIGIVAADTTAGDEGWIVLSVLVGFFVGGFFTGWRTGVAPILHGIGIGLFSLIVWFIISLLYVGTSTYAADWEVHPLLAASLLILHLMCAVFGTLFGVRMTHEAPREA